ncbi:MAG: AAA family ATPase [Tannerella sp.]|jgi:predicted ATP-dependent endonuclease of OLD family|nr:AAA family ATPase [Tannerella sp.]
MSIIKHISLTGLLDKYSLEWDLYGDVNILVGINGSGKTTILRCLDALLSEKHAYLKHLDIGVEVTLCDGSRIAYPGQPGAGRAPLPPVSHEYITTFDVPLKDKRGLRQNETPLDKELQSVIYSIGNQRKSFSNYRFKATNFPESAGEVNRRIDTLFTLTDRLFAETGKRIEINREDNSLGFRKDEAVIPLERLSSGEKQLLVILFTLFLMEDEPYLLLMDEPEISLHIGWQQQLIDVIRTLNPHVQLVMATHSPSIFGDGWGDRLFFTEDLIQLP